MSNSYDIDQDFTDPFSTGSGSDEVDDWGLPVSINGRPFVLDTASQDFSRRSIKLLNTQTAQTGQDYAMEPPTVWRRSTESWHLGADQSRFDRSDSLESRFHRSVGVDPWTKYGFGLLPETKLFAPIGATESALLVAIGDAFFVSAASYVDYYTSVGDLVADRHVTPAAVVSATSDGESFYVLCANGVVEKRDNTGAWTTFYTEPSLNPAKAMLAYAKGYILLGNGPDLVNITSQSRVLIYKHPLTGWWWRAASEGLSVIYILGGMGDRWHVHGVTIVTSSASAGAVLQPPVVATTLPDGEVSYAIDSYMGYVLIGSSNGWRFAMPDSSGALTYGQLIETAGPVRCFEGQGRFVWFGLSLIATAAARWDDNVDAFAIYTNGAGLGRADLSQPLRRHREQALHHRDQRMRRRVLRL